MNKLAASLVLLLAAGCTFFQDTNPEKPLTESRWRQMRQDNAQRLAGEDKAHVDAVDAVIGFIPGLVVKGLENAWNYTTGNTPAQWAKNMLQGQPDQKRVAIFKFAARKWGRIQNAYRDYFKIIAASGEEDFTVRAAAIRALNRSRRNATGPYLGALEDSQPLVRLEAAKALANNPDVAAIGPLITHMENPAEEKDVRIAAADALRCYARSDAAQSLIRVLMDKDFSVSWQARKSLNLLTGRDFQYDQARWLSYLTSSANPAEKLSPAAAQ